MLVVVGACLAVLAAGLVLIWPRARSRDDRADLLAVIACFAATAVGLLVAWVRPFPGSPAIAVAAILLSAAVFALRRTGQMAFYSRDWWHIGFLGLVWPVSVAAMAYAAMAIRASLGTVDGRLGVVAALASVLVAAVRWATPADRARLRPSRGALLIGITAAVGLVAGWTDSWHRPDLIIGGTILLLSVVAWVSAGPVPGRPPPGRSPRLDLGGIARVTAIHVLLLAPVPFVFVLVVALLRPV